MICVALYWNIGNSTYVKLGKSPPCHNFGMCAMPGVQYIQLVKNRAPETGGTILVGEVYLITPDCSTVWCSCSASRTMSPGLILALAWDASIEWYYCGTCAASEIESDSPGLDILRLLVGLACRGGLCWGFKDAITRGCIQSNRETCAGLM